MLWHIDLRLELAQPASNKKVERDGADEKIFPDMYNAGSSPQ